MLQHDAGAAAGPFFSMAEARIPFPVLPAADFALDLHLQQVHRYLITTEGAGCFSEQLQASPQYLRLKDNCQAACIRENDEDCTKISQLLAAVLEELRKLPGCGVAQPVQLTEEQQLSMSIGVKLPCNTQVRHWAAAAWLETRKQPSFQDKACAGLPCYPHTPCRWRLTRSWLQRAWPMHQTHTTTTALQRWLLT